MILCISGVIDILLSNRGGANMIDIPKEMQVYYHDNILLTRINRYNHTITIVYDNGNILKLYPGGYDMFDPFYQHEIMLSLKEVCLLLFK